MHRMFGARVTRRSLLGGAVSLGLDAVAAPLGFTTRALAAAPKFKTVEDGFLTIAVSGSMPFTGLQGGKMIGTDADMVVAIAKRLGLTPKPAVMAWSATIEAIKAGRADIMCGDMGWSKARVNALALTDAIYYAGNYITMKKDKPFSGSMDVNQMANQRIGTVTGYSYVPNLKKVSGADLKLYDTDDGCMRDLEAGRIDFAVLDGPTVDYMLSKNPGTDLKLVPIKANTEYPSLSGKGQAIMGMSLDNPDLFDAINAGIRWLWASKTNAECLARYGMTSSDYLVAIKDNPRVGIDRGADGAILGPGAHRPKDFASLFA